MYVGNAMMAALGNGNSDKIFVQQIIERVIDTEKGPSMEEMKDLCLHGLHIYVARHPILRLVKC